MAKYDGVMEYIFARYYAPGMTRIRFTREEFNAATQALGLGVIKDLGDIIYSFRYRSQMPKVMQDAAPAGYQWIILGVGIATYELRLANAAKVQVSPNRVNIKIPNATPETLKQYAPSQDEQALLTRVRYNRLIDLFTGLTCYSIQSHYRTTVDGIGQIEVDEIYVGVSKNGAHYILPCQAKSPKDYFGIAQVYQDIMLCRQHYPSALCRPIGIQFTSPASMAILELAVSEENEIFTIGVVEEKHYRLVAQHDIEASDLAHYGQWDRGTP